jgi:hypothetical protein
LLWLATVPSTPMDGVWKRLPSAHPPIICNQ